MPPTPPAGPPERVLDDLPGFFAAPPGAPPAPPATGGGPTDTPAPARPAATPAVVAAAALPDDPGEASAATPASPATPTADGGARRAGRRRRGVLAAAVAVTAGAVVAAVALGGGGGPADPPAAGSAGTRPDPTTSTGTAPGRTTTAPATSAAPLTAASAGDLATTDLDPGDEGFTAEASFGGVVLEPRAVGVTVAYPRVRVSSDGDATLAHVELEVWNCLADAPPADPSAADCRRGLAEYADLPSPDLRAERTGDGVQLTGSFPTYTRPNGSAPAYTGRSYALAVQLRDRGGAVTGTLQLGDGQAAAEPGGTYTGG